MTQPLLPLNGHDGKVTVDLNDDGVDVTIGGWSSFTISADSRNVVDVPIVFGQERATNLIQHKGPISFSFEGYYLLGIDGGQNYLKEAYDNETQITSLKFWIDETNYIQAVSGDYWRINEIGAINQTASGFATFSAAGFLYFEYEYQTVS